jgi:hypothetical protein
MTLKEWKDKKKIITMVSIVFIFIAMMKKEQESIATQLFCQEKSSIKIYNYFPKNLLNLPS